MKSYGIVGATDDEVQTAIQAKYGAEPDKLSYAEEIAVLAGEYSRSLPKSYNAEKVKKREFRRNAKRKLLEQAKAKIQPKGFIGGFIFMAIISGIISWFVQRLLRNYFDESPKGMFALDDLNDEESDE